MMADGEGAKSSKQKFRGSRVVYFQGPWKLANIYYADLK